MTSPEKKRGEAATNTEQAELVEALPFLLEPRHEEGQRFDKLSEADLI